jgi:hypothetical protein
LLGFFYGAAGWFFHPAFAKDQWRQVVEFLRPRLAEEEIAVLVSGHAWPVWAYYAPDLPAVRLPALEILDVDAVLDFATTGPSAARQPLPTKPGAAARGWSTGRMKSSIPTASCRSSWS